MGDNEAAKGLLTPFDATAAPARPAPAEPSRTRRLADDLSDEDAAPAPKRLPRWTSDEEARLRTLVGEPGGETWKTIAESLGTGRTGHAVEQKWAKLKAKNAVAQKPAAKKPASHETDPVERAKSRAEKVSGIEGAIPRPSGGAPHGATWDYEKGEWDYEKPASKKPAAAAAAPVEKKKRARVYRCRRCGLPKAGHICMAEQKSAHGSCERPERQRRGDVDDSIATRLATTERLSARHEETIRKNKVGKQAARIVTLEFAAKRMFGKIDALEVEKRDLYRARDQTVATPPRTALETLLVGAAERTDPDVDATGNSGAWLHQQVEDLRRRRAEQPGHYIAHLERMATLWVKRHETLTVEVQGLKEGTLDTSGDGTDLLRKLGLTADFLLPPAGTPPDAAPARPALEVFLDRTGLSRDEIGDEALAWAKACDAVAEHHEVRSCGTCNGSRVFSWNGDKAFKLCDLCRAKHLAQKWKRRYAPRPRRAPAPARPRRARTASSILPKGSFPTLVAAVLEDADDAIAWVEDKCCIMIRDKTAALGLLERCGYSRDYTAFGQNLRRYGFVLSTVPAEPSTAVGYYGRLTHDKWTCPDIVSVDAIADMKTVKKRKAK